MSPAILGDEIKTRIPPLYSQDRSDDPIIYARLFSPGNKWQCLVAEGCERNDTFLIFGLFLGNGSRWGQIEFGELSRMIADEGAPLCIDREFKPVRLSALTGMRRNGRPSI